MNFNEFCICTFRNIFPFKIILIAPKCAIKIIARSFMRPKCSMIGRTRELSLSANNRFHKNSKEIGLPQPIERREANDFMCAVFNRVYPIFQINDFFSGFLAFRLDAIPHYMDLRGSRYASPARMWPCLVGAGLRISEIAIPCIYLSQNNNFLRQYSSMEDLGYHIIKEFIDSSIRHIGKPKEKILSSLFKELETGKYESTKSWLEPAFIRYCK